MRRNPSSSPRAKAQATVRAQFDSALVAMLEHARNEGRHEAYRKAAGIALFAVDGQVGEDDPRRQTALTIYRELKALDEAVIAARSAVTIAPAGAS